MSKVRKGHGGTGYFYDKYEKIKTKTCVCVEEVGQWEPVCYRCPYKCDMTRKSEQGEKSL